jgi:hypothetical protein
VPHIRGFPLLGWQLARAESTSRAMVEPVQSDQSELCVAEEPWWHHNDPGLNDSQDSLHKSHWLEMQRRNNQSQTRC